MDSFGQKCSFYVSAIRKVKKQLYIRKPGSLAGFNLKVFECFTEDLLDFFI